MAWAILLAVVVIDLALDAVQVALSGVGSGVVADSHQVFYHVFQQGELLGAVEAVVDPARWVPRLKASMASQWSPWFW